MKLRNYSMVWVPCTTSKSLRSVWGRGTKMTSTSPDGGDYRYPVVPRTMNDTETKLNAFLNLPLVIMFNQCLRYQWINCTHSPFRSRYSLPCLFKIIRVQPRQSQNLWSWYVDSHLIWRSRARFNEGNDGSHSIQAFVSTSWKRTMRTDQHRRLVSGQYRYPCSNRPWCVSNVSMDRHALFTSDSPTDRAATDTISDESHASLWIQRRVLSSRHLCDDREERWMIDWLVLVLTRLEAIRASVLAGHLFVLSRPHDERIIRHSVSSPRAFYFITDGLRYHSWCTSDHLRSLDFSDIWPCFKCATNRTC